MTAVAPAGGRVALAVEGMVKSYGPTRALAGATFAVREGEVHALLGGNGCGKSTLIKVLAGVVTGDAGTLRLHERTELAAAQLTPSVARAEGLRFVHQHPAVFDDLTVAENLALGRGYATHRWGGIRWADVTSRAQAVLDRFEIDARPEQSMTELRPATRAMIAIARALQDQESDNRGILVLDEPTASLPTHEVEVLLAALRRYAALGQTILYVTHRLDEVLRVADSITVMRDGQVVTTRPREGMTQDDLVELIVGRAVTPFAVDHAESRGAPVLVASGLATGPLTAVDLDICAGEIVGIAGLIGSGRSTLLRTIFGLHRATAGSLELTGTPFAPRRPLDAMQRGVALVPEDRAREAAFADLTVAENLSMGSVGAYWRRGRLQGGAEDADARRLLVEYKVRCAGPDAPFRSLSGGNQQKVVLARWLRRSPDLILLDEPTQGVDVGSRAEIYEFIQNAVRGGSAVLVVSSEFEELASICHRVLVLGNGSIGAELPGTGLDAAAIERAVHRHNMEASA